MKYFLTFALLLSVATFAGDKKDHSQKMEGEAKAMECELQEGQAHTTISLPTAQCSMCEKTIETAVKKVDGVSMVNVSAKEGQAHVHFAKAEVKVEELEKAIAAVGYDANDTKRNEEAHAKLPQCCKMEK